MSKYKVLYVDDEAINLMLFKINLQKKYEVITAENGIEALELLSTEKDINLVFSDMRMPEMNGIEFITLAKKRFPEIKFYILTGFEITAEIEKAMNNGLITKYFQKPFNINLISLEIENILSGKLD
jgi:response regulator RpfG family c-di-GMP phosphodiesterase